MSEVARSSRILRALGFLILSFPLRPIQFVLPFVLVVLGFATTMIRIGIPILLLATSLLRRLGNLERRWVHRMLDVPIPSPALPVASTAARSWQARLVDSATWREFGYLLLVLPIGLVELLAGLVCLVLFPLAPRIGALHGEFALRMLGPSRVRELQVEADRLQASRARGVDAAEVERKRIERDLHDGAQQRLVALAMNLGRAQHKLADDPDSVRELIAEAHSDAKLAVSELRDLARGIYPAVLADRGLDAALSGQAAKSPIPVAVEVTVDPRPPAAVETTAYFIVGEALTNIAKHAGASRADVRVWRDGERVIVEITDDGHGGAQLRPGGGLAGLADRAVMIDGTVTVHSPVGGPTTVRAELPCQW